MNSKRAEKEPLVPSAEPGDDDEQPIPVVPVEAKPWIQDDVDYEGQRVVEVAIQAIMVASGVTGFIAGYLAKSLQLSFLIVLIGTLISAVVAIPPWPVYKKHPIKWLDDIRTEKQKLEDLQLEAEGSSWWWPF